MKILAIETSCDDTGIAVLEIHGSKKPVFSILSNVVSSQIEIHKKFGGVYPMMAKREHQRNLLPVLIQALEQSKLLKISKSECQISNNGIQTLKKILEREPELAKQFFGFIKKYRRPDIDAIAVTIGPGLEPCLWTGINFAKALAFYWQLPVIPINHIEGHLLAIFFNTKYQILNTKYLFPAIGLVVSGGNTQLILIYPRTITNKNNQKTENVFTFGAGVKKIWQYKIVGETRDDAAGECFDKIARILGLGYPGGPEIARIASQFRGKNLITLPRPMLNSDNFDFSFSGLKTAVLYQTIKDGKKAKNKKYIQEMCAAAQQAIIDVLISKTLKAAQTYKAKTIMIGGGVSANLELRRQFREKIEKELPNIKYYMPNTIYCGDNAAMIALAGYFNLKKKTKKWQKLSADGNLKL